jgi:IclR family pca regulon transcriptional regulator
MYPATAWQVTHRGDGMAVVVSRKSRSKKKSDHAAASLRAPRAATLPSVQINALCGDPNFMASLARGLSVIQCFSHDTSFLTVSQLSKATGLSRAAVRRCLYTLNKLGLADSEDGTHFTLLPRILTLGHSYISSMPLAKVAQPILDRLSQVLRESCSIAMRDGHDIIHIAHSNVSRVLAIDLSMGSRLPDIYTSMGRALLAHLPAKDLEAHLARAEFIAHTKYSITDVNRLRQALDMVRRTGYAVVDQELELGLCALAIPLRNSGGKVIAALNVGAPAQRVSARDLVTNFLPHLQAAAQELSMLLK